MLALDEHIKSIAEELYQQRSLLVMGRGYNYATCLEGALVSSNSTCRTDTLSVWLGSVTLCLLSVLSFKYKI